MTATKTSQVDTDSSRNDKVAGLRAKANMLMKVIHSLSTSCTYLSKTCLFFKPAYQSVAYFGVGEGGGGVVHKRLNSLFASYSYHFVIKVLVNREEIRVPNGNY